MPVKPVITVGAYDRELAAGKPFTLSLQVGDTKVVIRKDAGDRLWIDAENAAGEDHTGSVRQLRIVGAGTPPPPPPVDPPVDPPPPVDPGPPVPAFGVYALQVEVFEGDPADDQKIRTASVTFGNRTMTVDAAGNAQFLKIAKGTHALKVSAPGYAAIERQATAPGILKVVLERTGPGPGPEPSGTATGVVRAERDVFRHESGAVWSWQGATMFLLFKRFFDGEDLEPELAWMTAHRVNVARVLGMVAWPGQAFGPSAPGYFDRLREFMRVLAGRGLRVEFTVFADAQRVMPDEGDQRRHLRAVLDQVGNEPNLFVEVANEPWQNGVTPTRLIGRGDSRPCPVAFGDYDPVDGALAALDYLTVHLSRDRQSWSRKAKDILEYRTGGVSVPPIPALRVPVVSDEPMGAAEPDRVAGRQRSDNPDEFFWHHALCHLFGAGSTFHYDDGLQGRAPAPGSRQEACAEAVALAWSLIPPDVQTWTYTRSGLNECPLRFDPAMFPEDTSRIYAQLGGDRAVALAIKPNDGWQPEAVGGWRIVSTGGPRNSLVWLAR